MGKDIEKSYDDLVYEDEFYEQVFSEGKVVITEEEAEARNIEEGESYEIILVCEDCSHQWEDVTEDGDLSNLFCPMCGSNRVIQV